MIEPTEKATTRSHLMVVGSIWHPTVYKGDTHSRIFLGIDPGKARALDRVNYGVLRMDQTVAQFSDCMMPAWRRWVSQYRAIPMAVREAPAFDTQGKGLTFFAKDSNSQWYYVNHANTWATCPPPIS
jgi:hypothetical protein